MSKFNITSKGTTLVNLFGDLDVNGGENDLITFTANISEGFPQIFDRLQESIDFTYRSVRKNISLYPDFREGLFVIENISKSSEQSVKFELDYISYFYEDEILKVPKEGGGERDVKIDKYTEYKKHTHQYDGKFLLKRAATESLIKFLENTPESHKVFKDTGIFFSQPYMVEKYGYPINCELPLFDLSFTCEDIDYDIRRKMYDDFWSEKGDESLIDISYEQAVAYYIWRNNQFMKSTKPKKQYLINLITPSLEELPTKAFAIKNDFISMHPPGVTPKCCI